MKLDKRKRISVILTGVLLAIAWSIFSQPKQLPEQLQKQLPEQLPSLDNIIAKMQQDLNLSDEQVRQITPIMQNAIQQRRAIRSQGLDQDTVRTQMQEVQQSTESKLSQYLTQDQLTLWKKIRPQPPSQK